MVLVPGLACAAFMYDRLALALSRHHQVWTYDPPGHGRSQGRRNDHLTIDRLTDHLSAWLTEARLDGAVLVGHSLGGEVAIALAARNSFFLSSLVLLAPTGVPDNPNVLMQVLRLLADGVLEPPSFLTRVIPAYLRVGPRRLYHVLAAQAQHSTVPLLPRVRVPVLVIEGRHDPVIPHSALRVLCDHLPTASTRTVDGPHAFWYSHPARTAALMHEFVVLRALEPSR